MYVVYVHIYELTYVHMYAYMHVYICIYEYMFVSVCMDVCLRASLLKRGGDLRKMTVLRRVHSRSREPYDIHMHAAPRSGLTSLLKKASWLIGFVIHTKEQRPLSHSLCLSV